MEGPTLKDLYERLKEVPVGTSVCIQNNFAFVQVEAFLNFFEEGYGNYSTWPIFPFKAPKEKRIYHDSIIYAFKMPNPTHIFYHDEPAEEDEYSFNTKHLYIGPLMNENPFLEVLGIGFKHLYYKEVPDFHIRDYLYTRHIEDVKGLLRKLKSHRVEKECELLIGFDEIRDYFSRYGQHKNELDSLERIEYDSVSDTILRFYEEGEEAVLSKKGENIPSYLEDLKKYESEYQLKQEQRISTRVEKRFYQWGKGIESTFELIGWGLGYVLECISPRKYKPDE